MSVHSSSVAAPRVCLFEDDAVAGLEPLALTRPAFDLLCGLTSLGDKQCRAFGAPSRSAAPGCVLELADIVRRNHPNPRRQR